MSFFFWPLCCLFFFDLQILITSLISSNSSYGEIYVRLTSSVPWFVGYSRRDKAAWDRLISLYLHMMAWIYNNLQTDTRTIQRVCSCQITWHMVWILCSLFVYILPLENSLTGLAPHIFVPFPSQDMEFQRHMSWSCYVQWVKARSDYSFCWYWGNCWPSLSKRFFLSIVEILLISR